MRGERGAASAPVSSRAAPNRTLQALSVQARGRAGRSASGQPQAPGRRARPDRREALTRPGPRAGRCAGGPLRSRGPRSSHAKRRRSPRRRGRGGRQPAPGPGRPQARGDRQAVSGRGPRWQAERPHRPCPRRRVWRARRRRPPGAARRATKLRGRSATATTSMIRGARGFSTVKVRIRAAARINAPPQARIPASTGARPACAAKARKATAPTGRMGPVPRAASSAPPTAPGSAAWESAPVLPSTPASSRSTMKNAARVQAMVRIASPWSKAVRPAFPSPAPAAKSARAAPPCTPARRNSAVSVASPSQAERAPPIRQTVSIASGGPPPSLRLDAAKRTAGSAAIAIHPDPARCG